MGSSKHPHILVISLRMRNHDDDDDHDDQKDDDDDDDGMPNYCPKDDGMFPNPTDCATYYNCVDGTAIAMSCAPGLLFDADKKMCNFADRVKCKSMYCAIHVFLTSRLRRPS
ncbi:hypothetical protein AVEN_165059-1 [Araneus ventricosus]|uniref:Chitin-binding type-2 domain-containing protein n=1 Tax=Araneus ventricosus TaxID=182803 RepID=A0A4Y2A621_ARAVE|nr:hypothetical protein AVEN_115966-1 [Araneus ventricosus]GBL75218.1 hypothetical protein AVEN_165059-1 [Araneus ventricosus]